MKAWLCLNPVRLSVGGAESEVPPECLCLLAVYKYKKTGREIHGSKAQFISLDLPLARKKEKK